MQLIRHLPDKADAATAVAIGNFDGLHLGHQAVLAAMGRAAKANGLVPAVLTFEPHPRRFFAPASPAFRLERLSVKLRRLRDAGVERVYMPRFNKAFSSLTAEQFLDEVLGKQLGAKAVITGENFAFGKDRSGDIDTLRVWGKKNNVEVVAVPPVRFGEAICSSSAVRAALATGDVVGASHLLGRPYSLEGRVVHGDGRGKSIGFATANVSLPPTLKLPALGVYAVTAVIDEGDSPLREQSSLTPQARDGTLRKNAASMVVKGVANLGIKPTVSVDNSPNRPILEVHLFDVEPEIYGKRLFVTFVDYLRQEKRFNGVDALVAQIKTDCETAKIILAKESS